MALFGDYETDFLEIKSTLEKRISTVQSLPQSTRSAEVKAGYEDIAEGENLLKQMNLSARTAVKNESMLQKIKAYENDLAKLKTSLKKAEISINIQNDRSELMKGVVALDDIDMSTSMGQREQLQSVGNKMKKTTNDIDDAISLTETTIQVGTSTLEELDRQRSVMEQLIEKTRDINVKLSYAGRIMKKMGRRMIANKIIMGIIILVLLISIVVIIYFKWFYNSSSSSDSTGTTGTSTGDMTTTTTGTTGALTSTTTN